MGDEHVDHRDLRQVGLEAADRAGAHHGAAIVGNRLHDCFELAAPVRQHAQRNALGEIGHDRVGDGALELGIHVARGESRAAGGEIEVDRREVGKTHAQRAEQAMRMLHHAARPRPDRDPPYAQIGK